MTYGGDLSPEQCWDMLSGGAILVDVRTRAEWAFIGLPKLDGEMKPIVTLEWQVFPNMAVNHGFDETLKNKLDQMGADEQTNICFLCRSGVRSLAAAKAMTAMGYPNTYNITGGFEGDLNGNRHRGTSNGWKAAGLPWQQT